MNETVLCCVVCVPFSVLLSGGNPSYSCRVYSVMFRSTSYYRDLEFDVVFNFY